MANGLLIVNADDWGCDCHTTDRILESVERGPVTSVSAMVFMADSERAARMAIERGMDAGLHVNLTAPFTALNLAPRLLEYQRKVTRYLRSHRLAQMVFNPVLAQCFRYVVDAQVDEFRRLYGGDPKRLDGHHHMHLCANVLFGKLLPKGTIARRNFSFQKGEKSVCNRLYRRWVDGILGRRHMLVDHFFSLIPLDHPSRLKNIFSLAHQTTVELETHPVNPEEYRFLLEGELWRCDANPRIGSSLLVRTSSELEK